MSSFWDAMEQVFGWFFNQFPESESDSDSDFDSEDYLPPTTSHPGKRKAAHALPRPSSAYKAQRPSPSISNRTPLQYDSASDSSEPEYLARGSEIETETDSAIEDSYYPDRFLQHRNSLERARAKRSLAASARTRNQRRSSPGRRVSAERVRDARVNFFGGLGNSIATAAKSVVSTLAGGTESPSEVGVAEKDIQEELMEDSFEGSDVDLSEGEWGRKYWATTPWKEDSRTGVSGVMYEDALPELEDVGELVGRGKSEQRTNRYTSGSQGYAAARVDDDIDMLDYPTQEPEVLSRRPPRPKKTSKPSPLSKAESTPVRPATSRLTAAAGQRPTKAARPAPAAERTGRKTPKAPRVAPTRPKETPSVRPKHRTPPSSSAGRQSDPRPHFKEWSTNPARRTKELITQWPKSYGTKILEELEEPEYTVRDVEIRDMYWQIMDLTQRLAHRFFDGPLSEQPMTANEMRERVQTMYKRLDPATSLIIGCIASGGPAGDDGWHGLFIDPRKRQALVCGIIGNVLVEQVFKHPCFGASQRTLDALISSQSKHRDDDGFVRKLTQATLIHPLLYNVDPQTLSPPLFFTAHVERIVSSLLVHLLPIFALFTRNDEIDRSFEISPSHPDQLQNRIQGLDQNSSKLDPNLFDELTKIVTSAALLSLIMASDPHTVYHFVPIFKEDDFDQRKCEAFNRKQMEATHPRNSATIWPPGTTEAERKRAQGDDALNQILLMSGITAYRKGGWEDWKTSRPKWVGGSGGEKWSGRTYKNAGDRARGFRARVLAHGWVFCRWGRARHFDRAGNNDDRVEVHGEANWRAPGFVEFRDVVRRSAGRGSGASASASARAKGKRPVEGEGRYL